VLADAGVASRRACEALIEDGGVRVNGRVVRQNPTWVDPASDQIEVAGEVVRPADRLLYVLLNKPARFLCTAKSEPHDTRRTVLDLVDHPSGIRLFPVGRLDFETTGLLVLTNDGEMANRLTHPRYAIEKTYHALVRGRLDDDDAREIARGIYLADRKAGHTVGALRTGHVTVEISKRDRDRTTLRLTLREGRNREVRRLLASVGCPVKRLERVEMGPLRLKGVARGAWRELTRDEIRALRRCTTRRDRDSRARDS